MGSKAVFLGLILLAGSSARADTLEIVRRIPHSGYSEGLDWYDGFLWNSLPKEIVKIDPKDGSVLARYEPATSYSESLKWVKGKLWNVSYADNGIYEGAIQGKKLVFQRKGTTPEVHAWGLEFDGMNFLMTGNYSDKIYFVDPKTLRTARVIQTPVKDIEDLAWDGTGIWASSYTQYPGTIFRIDPKTGKISRFFRLPKPEECPVVDGLAYDGEHLWLTGKHCTSIYQLKRPADRLLAYEK